MKLLLRIIKWLGLGLLGLILLGVLYGVIISEKLPEGTSGPAADEVAQKMLTAINYEAWQQTGAVSFNFGPHKHMWDKDRSLASVEWDENKALVNLTTRKGIAYQDGQEISGEKADEIIEMAWLFWVNDAFWFNAPAKVFDQGVTRSLVATEEGPHLLVSFASGGATPGDSYLWKLDPQTYRPLSWRMWVSIIPVGGADASWEDWKQLETGAWVSTQHQIGPLPRNLNPVKGASSIRELTGGSDPFYPLIKAQK